MRAKRSDQATSLEFYAKRLRCGQTDAERKLWMHLRSRQMNGFKFRRQHLIGRYIVDFCSPERHLVVELDGGHHTGQTHTDQRRTEYLTRLGYRVLRFWDHEVLVDTEAVIQRIAAVANLSPLAPSGRGEGEGSKDFG